MKEKKNALTPVIKASLLENYGSDTLNILVDLLRTTGTRE